MPCTRRKSTKASSKPVLAFSSARLLRFALASCLAAMLALPMLPVHLAGADDADVGIVDAASDELAVDAARDGAFDASGALDGTQGASDIPVASGVPDGSALPGPADLPSPPASSFDGASAQEEAPLALEASEQVENSFRYADGRPISSIAPSISTFALQARASMPTSFVRFLSGACSGDDAAKGIDVSKWQGSIDWGRVKLAGVDFAIIRCAAGTTQDPYFAKNVSGARQAGIGIGVYYYTYAQRPEQGAIDASRVISQLRAASIAPASLMYPIYYDLEDDAVASMSAHDKALLAKGFVDALHAAGYSKAGVYSNMEWWTSQLVDPYFSSTSLCRWVAQYNDVGLGCNYPNSPFGSFRERGDVWQFTCTGRVSGISGNVDLNYSYHNAVGISAAGSMFRLYNPYSGEHFYTASSYEANYLARIGWNYEGVAWIAPAWSRTPVYRLYNPVAGDHHYTSSAYERDVLARCHGWNYEGIGWYSDDARGTALHRLYNPNARTGTHHYTASTYERDVLVRQHGWRYEGIGWYGN